MPASIQNSINDIPSDFQEISSDFQEITPNKPTSALGELLGGRFNQILPALENYASQRGEELHKASQPGADISPIMNMGIGFGSLPMAGVQGVKNALPFLTKGGAAKKATEGAVRATKEGAYKTWNDVTTEIKAEVGKKLGNTKEVQKAVNNLLSEKRPASVESLPDTLKKTPTELLDWRRQILARESPGILKWFTGGTVDDKVAGITRSIISKNLHEIASDTILPDKLFSLYSRGGIFGGDIPQLLLKYLIAPIAAKTVGGPILRDITRKF